MEETLKLILDKLNSMDSDIKDLKSEVRDIKNRLLIIEEEHGKKLDTLFDGYKQLYEEQQEMKKDIKDIKETLSAHELKLKIIKWTIMNEVNNK